MSNHRTNLVTWVEIDKSALAKNCENLRKHVAKKIILAPPVKGNAYGHGLVLASEILAINGADWLCVNALFEARALRKAGIRVPIYIMGYVPASDFDEALILGCRLVVYNKESLGDISKAAQRTKKSAKLHVKIETGNNRQGVLPEELVDFVRCALALPGIEVEGIATHFANIEDVHLRATMDAYPALQLQRFKMAHAILQGAGIHVPLQHCANSAATILFPETHFSLVRPGIAIYGLWPSRDVERLSKKIAPALILKAVLSWHTRIAQIKNVPSGSYIGYGCTYKTKRATKLAILPTGYYDGYDRGLSNKGYVLVNGKRAPVRGRIFMNMTAVDVTNIPQVKINDRATLLGSNGTETISAEQLAKNAGTINYEITTRINEVIPRITTN